MDQSLFGECSMLTFLFQRVNALEQRDADRETGVQQFIATSIQKITALESRLPAIENRVAEIFQDFYHRDVRVDKITQEHLLLIHRYETMSDEVRYIRRAIETQEGQRVSDATVIADLAVGFEPQSEESKEEPQSEESKEEEITMEDLVGPGELPAILNDMVIQYEEGGIQKNKKRVLEEEEEEIIKKKKKKRKILHISDLDAEMILNMKKKKKKIDSSENHIKKKKKKKKIDSSENQKILPPIRIEEAAEIVPSIELYEERCCNAMLRILLELGYAGIFQPTYGPKRSQESLIVNRMGFLMVSAIARGPLLLRYCNYAKIRVSRVSDLYQGWKQVNKLISQKAPPDTYLAADDIITLAQHGGLVEDRMMFAHARNTSILVQNKVFQILSKDFIDDDGDGDLYIPKVVIDTFTSVRLKVPMKEDTKRAAFVDEMKAYDISFDTRDDFISEWNRCTPLYSDDKEFLEYGARLSDVYKKTI